MNWLIVKSDKVDAEELATEIRGLNGVTDVEVEGDDFEYLLREIGEKMWEIEDMKSLDCPLREVRQAIEKLLDEDFKYLPKEPSETLSWCSAHVDGITDEDWADWERPLCPEEEEEER